MTVALALLTGAAVVALAGPRALRAAAARSVDPVTVIAGWYLAMAGVAVTAGCGLLLAAVPQRAADGLLAELVGRSWWTAVAAAPQLAAYRIAGWVAPGLLVAALLWVGVVAVRRRRRVRRAGAGLDRLRMVARTERGSGGDPPTLWLDAERPAAFSIGGRDAMVVLTAGLRARLSGPAVQAVLAHERAHVRGRHHAVVGTAEVLAGALPMVRLFAEAPAALREQVELAADLAAVRRCGPAAVRDALVALTGAGAPEQALAMARDAVDVRVRRLAAAVQPPAVPARLLRGGALGAAVALGPLAAACAVLLALSALALAAAVLA